jgi:ketosteroid isomerase-like protein
VNEARTNAELLRTTLAVYQQGDDETLRELMHPEIEIYSEPGMINAGTYSGYDGYRQWAAQWEEAWDEISYEALEIIDVSDTLLVARVRVVGRGAGSGLEIDREFGYLYELKEGRGTRFHVYVSFDSALEAANRLAEES